MNKFFKHLSNETMIRDRLIVAKNIVIKKLFLAVGVTKADLNNCGKMPNAREELNRSVKEGRIESRHSIKSLERMGSRYTTWEQKKECIL